ncbi:MAG TPA: TlpA disulfide reductase family protein [Candidatus Acidoferrum sp.]|nr:TlpA disulfide reductase family protein [Candidatus Acidoferrum sp.]
MFTRLLTAITALLLLAAATPGASDPDAKEILWHVREAYAHLKSFDFTSSAAGTFETDGIKYRMVIPQELARGDNPDEPLTMHYGLFRAEKLDGSGELSAVKPGFFGPPSMSYYEFDKLGSDVRYAKFLREDSASANGKSSPCFVIEVLRNPDPLAARQATPPSPQVLWIDKTAFLVLRETLQTESNEHTAIDWDVTFPSYKLNEPPPKWLADLKKGNEEQKAQRKAKMLGISAPSFKLADLDGHEIALADLHDKVVLLDFWATWCVECRPEAAIVSSVEKTWSAKGLVVLCITNESPEDVHFFFDKTHEPMPTLVNGWDVWTQYLVNVGGVPSFVLVDKAGKIVAYHNGFFSEAELTAQFPKAGLS